MKYIKIIFYHADNNLTFYLEVNEAFLELRKIELTENGLLGYASEHTEFHGTTLIKTPVLTIEELNTLTDTLAIEISQNDFELIWQEVIMANIDLS